MLCTKQRTIEDGAWNWESCIPDNDKRLVVYVSQELFQELETLATKEDRSTSNFTRNLIASAVEQYKKGKNL
jgi:metal-responsive CopG/Arc/MetJ family transcriptional regulator